MKKSVTGLSKVQRDRAPRVRSQMPVVLNGKKGLTQDISATGVYFELDDDQELGSAIEFTIELDTPGGKLEIRCTGEVVRLTNKDGKLGIAAKIIKQDIRSN
ncbi:hypothetical protein B6A14_09135 [Polynucleobacter hirudinilacicola]|uniref:PilZ domain-containing protein n=1 Tax=Polynucleobacter hirudinilacicola TaxID=1743166 RepID=A0A210RY86_9BURK|nr:PilZ domain-containing protein [Polynucleobacter hirudinilacicola]OWF65910.1 hypothetical protein B6A14_09135 [Polynucleobacter hirudinilacicola]